MTIKRKKIIFLGFFLGLVLIFSVLTAVARFGHFRLLADSLEFRGNLKVAVYHNTEPLSGSEVDLAIDSSMNQIIVSQTPATSSSALFKNLAFGTYYVRVLATIDNQVCVSAIEPVNLHEPELLVTAKVFCP